MTNRKQWIKLIVIITIVFSCFNGSAQFFSDSTNYLQVQPTDSIEIAYVVSKFNKTDSVYADTLKTKKILPGKSAIVLIDLWENIYLNSLVRGFVNPLITEANKLGIHVIYAPSQHKQNRGLKIADNSVTFYNLDNMDKFISKNEINNIFYAGFDALYCVIDKPNGVFAFRERNIDKEIDYFVFDKGVGSFTKEMKEVAISLFKKNDIGVLQTKNIMYENSYIKKTISDPFKKTTKDTVPGKDFVLVFKNDTTDSKLNNFSKNLQDSNIDYAEVVDGKLHFKDKTIHETYDFIQLLMELKINNLYYAGYHLNNEILWSKFGITNLYIKKRYFFINKLPNIFVVNDLVYIAKDADIDPSTEKSVIINHYREIKNILSPQLFNPK